MYFIIYANYFFKDAGSITSEHCIKLTFPRENWLPIMLLTKLHNRTYDSFLLSTLYMFLTFLVNFWHLRDKDGLCFDSPLNSQSLSQYLALYKCSLYVYWMHYWQIATFLSLFWIVFWAPDSLKHIPTRCLYSNASQSPQGEPFSVLLILHFWLGVMQQHILLPGHSF